MNREDPMPTELTTDDVQQIIALAPDPMKGLDKVLAMSGCWVPEQVLAAAVTAVIQHPGGDIPHISRTREPVFTWRDESYRVSIRRNLRERALRSVDRDGAAFVAQPVETVYALPEMDRGIELTDEVIRASAVPLTEEQLAALPDQAWIEIRLTVPIRLLPDGRG